jgi:diacylglycerol kinase
MKNLVSIKKSLKSFVFAFNGIRIFIYEGNNARIHIIAAMIAIILGILLKISLTEWMMVILVIGLVITLEIVNSAIESLADYVSPGKHDLIKKVKDLSAGGVLVSAISAVIIGLIIFLPKLLVYV